MDAAGPAKEFSINSPLSFKATPKFKCHTNPVFLQVMILDIVVESFIIHQIAEVQVLQIGSDNRAIFMRQLDDRTAIFWRRTLQVT